MSHVAEREIEKVLVMSQNVKHQVNYDANKKPYLNIFYELVKVITP